MRVETIKLVNATKAIIRQPYAWPGGYECFAITTDGAVLCTKCLRAEWHQVAHDTMVTGWNRTGWAVAAVDCVANVDTGTDEEPESLCCGHCSRDLLEGSH